MWNLAHCFLIIFYFSQRSMRNILSHRGSFLRKQDSTLHGFSKLNYEKGGNFRWVFGFSEMTRRTAQRTWRPNCKWKTRIGIWQEHRAIKLDSLEISLPPLFFHCSSAIVPRLIRQLELTRTHSYAGRWRGWVRPKGSHGVASKILKQNGPSLFIARPPLYTFSLYASAARIWMPSAV